MSRDALVHFGAVALASDKDAIEQVKDITHDRVVEQLGERRLSGVEWAIWDATEGPRILRLAGFRDHPQAKGMLDFLRQNPRGLLIMAKADYDPDAAPVLGEGADQ